MSKLNKMRGNAPKTPSMHDITTQMVTGKPKAVERLEGEIEALQNSAIVLDDGVYRFRGLEFSRTGFEIPSDISADDWLAIFHELTSMERALQWAIGDLIVHAETVWGQTYDEIAEITGYSKNTLPDFAYVARHIRFSLRHENLTFSHHKEVASLKSDKTKAKWLKRAADNGWSVRELRQQIKQSERDEKTSHSVTEDSWLFDKEQKPNLNYLQKQWAAARHGDEGARDRLREQVEATRQWLNEVMDSLDG